MRNILLRSFVLLAVCAIAGIGAHATTFTGTVHNGTNNTPAAGIDVVLISLQNEMTTVANTKTDASGHYQMDYAQTGQMPMLVRAIYKGVNFHGMLPPGKLPPISKSLNRIPARRQWSFPRDWWLFSRRAIHW